MNGSRIKQITGALFATVLFLTFPTHASLVAKCDESDLRTAIAAGGTVSFSCDGIITLTESILITNSTVLDGGGRMVTIRGNGTNRLFTVNSNGTLIARHLVLSDGIAIKGGAILNDGGQLILEEIRFYTNRATGVGNFRIPAEGGAVYSSGTLYASDCVFEGNESVGYVAPYDITGGPANKGGAVFIESGMAQLSHCQFRWNGAKGSLGLSDMSGYPGLDGIGGAIFNLGILTVQHCAFENNLAIGGDGGTGMPISGASGAMGGKGTGGAVYNAGTLTLYQSHFLQNGSLGGAGSIGQEGWGTAGRGGPGGSGGGGGAAWGAAIHNSGHAKVVGCDFISNLAKGGAAGSPGAGGFTGGDGGAGSAGGHAIGGAILGHSGSLTATNCTFTENSALAGPSSKGGNGGTGGFGLALGGNGGAGGRGADAFGAALCLSNTLAVVANCTIAGNTLLASQGQEGGLLTCGRFFDCGTNGLAGTNGSAEGLAFFVADAPASSLSLINTILAGTGSVSLCSGAMADGGHNLSSDHTPNFSSSTSRNNLDPLLGPLATNGGPTLTMLPRSDSPAIDAGDDLAAPATDQRGVPRAQGARSDIGAVEATFLTILRMANGNVRLRYAGIPGENYSLESTPAFGDLWSGLETKSAAANGMVEYSDRSSSGAPRLFRVRSQ